MLPFYSIDTCCALGVQQMEPHLHTCTQQVKPHQPHTIAAATTTTTESDGHIDTFEEGCTRFFVCLCSADTAVVTGCTVVKLNFNKVVLVHRQFECERILFGYMCSFMIMFRTNTQTRTHARLVWVIKLNLYISYIKVVLDCKYYKPNRESKAYGEK